MSKSFQVKVKLSVKELSLTERMREENRGPEVNELVKYFTHFGDAMAAFAKIASALDKAGERE